MGSRFNGPIFPGRNLLLAKDECCEVTVSCKLDLLGYSDLDYECEQ